MALLLFVLRGFLVDVALKPKDDLHPVLHMFRLFFNFHVIFYVLRNNVKKKTYVCSNQPRLQFMTVYKT